MTARSELQSAAAKLARDNQQDWHKFMQALGYLVEEHRNVCVMSPVDQLQVNQGRAQALTELILDLDECIKKDDEARKRKEKNL